MVFRAESPGLGGSGLIESILNYRGSARKDALRDADRRIRDAVAADYAALSARIRRVATELAEQRRIGEIAAVAAFADDLDHFVDRVRTATYGYTGLMDDMDPDSTAIRQLQAFDQGLASGKGDVERAVVALEAALSDGGDLASPSRQGRDAVRLLQQRFDLRARIAETGRPVDRESALKALGSGMEDQPIAAWSLDTGVALSVLGDDFIVGAKLGVQGDGGAFRMFRLSTDPEEWLFVPRDPSHAPARLHPVAIPEAGGAPALDGSKLRPVSEGMGEGEIVGAAGGSGLRQVRFLTFAGEDDAEVRGVLLDWGADHQAFAGRTVHPNDIEIFGTPKGI